MPLNKKDLGRIKSVVHEEIEEATDGLARIVNRGFEHVEQRFEHVDKRFEQVDQRFEQVDKRFESIDQKLVHIDTRLDTIEHDIAEIRKHFVYRDEFEEVLERLVVIEKKLGIKTLK